MEVGAPHHPVNLSRVARPVPTPVVVGDQDEARTGLKVQQAFAGYGCSMDQFLHYSKYPLGELFPRTEDRLALLDAAVKHKVSVMNDHDAVPVPVFAVLPGSQEYFVAVYWNSCEEVIVWERRFKVPLHREIPMLINMPSGSEHEIAQVTYFGHDPPFDTITDITQDRRDLELDASELQTLKETLRQMAMDGTDRDRPHFSTVYRTSDGGENKLEMELRDAYMIASLGWSFFNEDTQTSIIPLSTYKLG